MTIDEKYHCPICERTWSTDTNGNILYQSEVDQSVVPRKWCPTCARNPASYPVQSTVPLPAHRPSYGYSPKYRLHELTKKGMSIFIPCKNGQTSQHLQKTANTQTQRWKRKHGGKFSVRQWIEHEVAGVRIWRIE